MRSDKYIIKLVRVEDRVILIISKYRDGIIVDNDSNRHFRSFEKVCNLELQI
jgi:hypothetical protein